MTVGEQKKCSPLKSMTCICINDSIIHAIVFVFLYVYVIEAFIASVDHINFEGMLDDTSNFSQISIIFLILLSDHVEYHWKEYRYFELLAKSRLFLCIDSTLDFNILPPPKFYKLYQSYRAINSGDVFISSTFYNFFELNMLLRYCSLKFSLQ